MYCNKSADHLCPGLSASLGLGNWVDKEEKKICKYTEYNTELFYGAVRNFERERERRLQCYLFYNRNFPFLLYSTPMKVLFSVFSPMQKVTVVLQESSPSPSWHLWMLWIELSFSEAELHGRKVQREQLSISLPSWRSSASPLGAAQIMRGEGRAVTPDLLALLGVLISHPTALGC